MNQCGNGELFLQLVEQANFLLCFSGFVAAFIYQDKKWCLFSGLTSASYFLMVYFHCDIKLIDPEMIYRYVIWICNDLIWIAALYILWKKGLVYGSQFSIALAATLVMELLQVGRYFDRHFFDLQFTNEIYRSAMPVLNSLLAMCCWLPLKDKIWNRVKTWNIL